MAADLGLSLFTSAGILLALALISTTLRCITRIYIVKSFGMDDYFMVVTVLLYTHYCGWVFYGRSLDRGKDTGQIPLQDIPLALRAFYFAENSYILAAWTLKMSIGTFLLRILTAKSQIYTIYRILSAMTCVSVALFFMSVFQCNPINHFWLPESPGKCTGSSLTLGIAYFHAVIIAASDFAFAILPLSVIVRLQMARLTKISACILVGLGAFAGVTTLLRIFFIKHLGNSANFLHATAQLAIMSSVEPGLGIIIGSAAATRPLFRRISSRYHPFVPLTRPMPVERSNIPNFRNPGWPALRYFHDIEDDGQMAVGTFNNCGDIPGEPRVMTKNMTRDDTQRRNNANHIPGHGAKRGSTSQEYGSHMQKEQSDQSKW